MLETARMQVMRYISDGEPWPDERIREFVGRQVAAQLLPLETSA